MQLLPKATWKFTKWMALLGLICGVVYSVGGLVIDARTTGLNRGTALAFLALAGMPVVFAAAGILLGTLFTWVAKGIRVDPHER